MRRSQVILVRPMSFAIVALALVTSALHAPESLAAEDATAGARSFTQCSGCHSTAPGENKIGPSLAGVFGRKSGSEADFNYSSAMKNANVVWDEGTLDKFLASPSGFVHGTKMFTGVPDATRRHDVIAYLKTLKP